MDNNELRRVARKLVDQYAGNELQMGFKPTGLHRYDDEKGDLVYFRPRLKHPDGRKWIRPFHFDSKLNDWVMREPEFPTGKPLYRLPSLSENSHSEVWVVEGELKADVLEKLGFITTTSGGSTSASGVNWEPLHGRNVVIWRDSDEAGINYSQEVTEILHGLNCTIRYIDVDSLNLPKGGDVVDWLKVNPLATHDDILALL